MESSVYHLAFLGLEPGHQVDFARANALHGGAEAVLSRSQRRRATARSGAHHSQRAALWELSEQSCPTAGVGRKEHYECWSFPSCSSLI